MKVGRPHGLDGSFHVDAPLEEGATVTIGEREFRVVERKGTDERPIVRLAGVEDRDAAEELRGEVLSAEPEQPPGEGEWLVEDLVGCRIEGVGEVTGVRAGPSCDVLEVGDVLIPLVTDAVTRVDVERKLIEVDREFLGL
jgi:16S rRNA processing protein RimM